MNTRPKRIPGSRLCLALTSDGLTAYGNKEAFASLRDTLSWLERSNEEENFECHVTMSLEEDDSTFDRIKLRNVFTLIERVFDGIVGRKSKSRPGFELTFMLVSKEQLDICSSYQASGFLPDDWNS